MNILRTEESNAVSFESCPGVQSLKKSIRGVNLDISSAKERVCWVATALGCTDLLDDLLFARVAKAIYPIRTSDPNQNYSHLNRFNYWIYMLDGDHALSEIEPKCQDAENYSEYFYWFNKDFEYREPSFHGMNYSDYMCPYDFFSVFCLARRASDKILFLDKQAYWNKTIHLMSGPFYSSLPMSWTFISPLLKQCRGAIRHENILMWIRVWLFNIMLRCRNRDDIKPSELSVTTGLALLQVVGGNFLARRNGFQAVFNALRTNQVIPQECLVDLALMFPKLWTVNSKSTVRGV